MYAIRSLTQKNKTYRSFKLVIGKKSGPRIGYVFAKFGYFNNYYTSFFGGTSCIPFGDSRMFYIKENGYYFSNKVAAKGVGSCLGANVREIKKRRHY